MRFLVDYSKYLITTIVLAASSPLLSQADADMVSETVASVSGSVTIIQANGDPLDDRSNVVVFLDGVSADSNLISTTDPVPVSQNGGRFTPRVLPVIRGTTLRFFNDDDIFHNVFSLSKAAPFDLGIYPKGTYRDVMLSKTGVIKIYCNIHPDMVSTVVSLPNPWFDKTGRDGSFVIGHVPPGEYTLRIWHEYGGSLMRPLVLVAGATHVESAVIRNTAISHPHKNKFGKPYRKKY